MPRPAALLSAVLLAAGLCLVGPLAAQSPPASGPATQPAAMNDLEWAFAERLSGAVLDGSFTSDDQPDRLRRDTYEIVRATKLGGDTWLLVARIGFGGKTAAVPIPLTVRWAGDTPVIVLDNQLIPGLGRYSARVLFAGERYAGTWSGPGCGGQIVGRVTRPAASQPATTQPTP